MNLQRSGSRHAATTTTTTANIMTIIYVCLFLYSDFISSGDAPFFSYLDMRNSTVRPSGADR